MHHAARLRRVELGLRLCLGLGASIGVVAVPGSADAQPAGGVAGGAAAVPAAGSSGDPAPAGTDGPTASRAPAAAAAPAIGPPGRMPVAAPIERAATADDRDGVFFAGSLGVGLVVMADLRVGWMIGSRVSVFASLGAAAVLVDDGYGANLIGAGVRLWNGAGFIEGRFAEASWQPECDLDEEPCHDNHERLAIFGIGGELMHRRHVGVELRGDVFTDGRSGLYMLSLGVSVYP
jgi:hypothetical protein